MTSRALYKERGLKVKSHLLHETIRKKCKSHDVILKWTFLDKFEVLIRRLDLTGNERKETEITLSSQGLLIRDLKIINGKGPFSFLTSPITKCKKILLNRTIENKNLLLSNLRITQHKIFL